MKYIYISNKQQIIILLEILKNYDMNQIAIILLNILRKENAIKIDLQSIFNCDEIEYFNIYC